MSLYNELSYDLLTNEWDPGIFPFQDTSEVEPFHGIIGQERAVRAMEFGLKVKMKGYNLFLSGMSGTGKTSYALDYIRKRLVLCLQLRQARAAHRHKPSGGTGKRLSKGYGRFHQDLEGRACQGV